MGITLSKSAVGGDSTTFWKQLVTASEAREKYLKDGTIKEDSNEDELAFRVLLDETVCFDMIHNFANDQQKSKLKAWKALQQRYSNSGLMVLTPPRCSFFGTLSCTSNAQIGAISEDNGPTGGQADTTHDLASELEFSFDELYEELFLEFKKSAEYENMCAYLAARNQAKSADFDYFKKLGSGAFGLVVSCRKRSTGAIYAMKIQPKAALLHNNRNNRSAVMLEMLASTGCPSPFICQAAYAFQTTKLVFLALPLYARGDLRYALMIEPTGHFSQMRAQVYAAELATVLIFLHDHGLIHRDLKPENVFIDDMGHLVLGDLGSVAGRSKIPYQ
jgi:hypothetical protein